MAHSALRSHFVMSTMCAGLFSASALFIAACTDASNPTEPQRKISLHGPRREGDPGEICDDNYCPCVGETESVNPGTGIVATGGAARPTRATGGALSTSSRMAGSRSRRVAPPGGATPAANPCGSDPGGDDGGSTSDDGDSYTFEGTCQYNNPGSSDTSRTCQVYTLDDSTKQQVLNEAKRLQAQFPPGSQCNQLGQIIEANVDIIRQTPYGWVPPNYGGRIVTGDSHDSEPWPGAGRIHIALGYDGNTPDRGLPGKMQTVRHEFGHTFFGIPRAAPGVTDDADAFAKSCE